MLLTLSGELDENSLCDFEAALRGGPDEWPAAVIVNLRGLTFLSVGGLWLLTAVNADRRGIEISVVAPPRGVRRGLAVAGLTEQMPIFDTVEEAIVWHERSRAGVSGGVTGAAAPRRIPARREQAS
ncbi:STAS domain-containing protein [Rhodococcus tukisamuensis]|uniref:STAS domain-containing protein n=1 Tax=Rhodococcus tukisamuensis TaxID=168276 RepID=UPI0014738F67|nr:STAS domain-containing protein [Rhodococcus tukisamuensis]